MTLDELWPTRTPVVGMVHLLPLPGSPRWSGKMRTVTDRAVRDGVALAQGGVDGLMVENFQDVPFFPGSVPPETVAAMAVAVEAVMREVEIPVGINVLRNDASASLGIAAATGGAFIRVNVHTGSMFTDQGLLQGQAHETLRKRSALGTSTPILADVVVKHATPPPGTRLVEAARDAWFRGGADGIVLTGSATGVDTSKEDVEAVRGALPEEGRVWVGSGVTPESARAFEAATHGMIVGSTFQFGGVAGRGVDPARVRVFMEALGRSPG